MSTWYYHRNGRQEGPVPDDVFRQLVGSGQLKAGDLVWREGMQQWAPVESVAQVAQHAQPANQFQFGPAPVANQPAPQHHQHHAAPHGQTGGVTMSIGAPNAAWKTYAAALAVYLLSFVLIFFVAIGAGSLGAAANNPEQIMTALAAGLGIFGAVIGVVLLGAWLVYILAAACWQYHANINLRVAQLHDSPGPLASVFWWYIPLVNLVLPILSLASTDKASSALAVGNPNWRSHPTSGLFKAWAIFYMIAAVASILYWVLLAAGFAGGAGIMIAINIVGWLIAAILLPCLFASITKRQERFVR